MKIIYSLFLALLLCSCGLGSDGTKVIYRQVPIYQYPPQPIMPQSKYYYNPYNPSPYGYGYYGNDHDSYYVPLQRYNVDPLDYPTGDRNISVK